MLDREPAKSYSRSLQLLVRICPRALERQIIIVFICIVAYSVLSNPVIYYILLAAIGAVSGVFAYYPHPGGQA